MPKGALLFDLPDYPHERWTAHLRKFIPDLDIRATVDALTAADVAYCIAWKPAPGKLRSLPNLKIVFSMGAGVDGIVADPTYPRHIPLARVVDDTLAQAMSEYLVLNVLYWHRRLHDFTGLQREKKWRQLPAPRAPQIRVGILGFGVLGQAAAHALRALNYQLSGWSATPKHADGVKTFHGQGQLDAFLAQADILVCLLPLTPETRGILNAKTFASLPNDACIINAARGGHVVEDDLIRALDSGHLRGATLDVFSAEPLPATSPLWSHPKVVMTAHSAAFTDPESFMRQVAATIRRMDDGLPPENLVDFARGY
jgi:glyoxylate/hydroxypyruvate reductase A